MDLLADLRKGRRGAIAKAITIIENDQKQAKKLIKEIFPSSGNSTVIGITGSAGAGKSSLINKTVIALGKLGTKPAVLAVDPTSHVTGGAILGDRVRMSESTDSGTYIRSIASRGATGAVSRSLRNSIRVLEYSGFDPIIIESVGAGQTEVGISHIADITVVVFNPNTGDSIQTIKAGLTEIGDIYIVNKSDLAGTNQLYDAVRDFIGDRTDLKGDGSSAGRPPIILKTSVKKNTGITVFAKTLHGIMAEMASTTTMRNAQKLEAELKDIVLNGIRQKVDEMLISDKTFSNYLSKLQSKRMDPFVAGDKITKKLLGGY